MRATDSRTRKLRIGFFLLSGIGGLASPEARACTVTTVSTGSPQIHCVYDCVGGGGPLLDVNLTIPAGTTCSDAANQSAAASLGGCVTAISPISCSFGPVPSPSPGPSPSPSPSPSPTPPVNWADHRCGDAGAAPSEIPPSAPPGTTSFAQLANPVAACCLHGWAQGASTTSPSHKLDCTDSGPLGDFLAFYNYAGGDADRDAGIARPNRFFATVSGGSGLPGFYDRSGAKCPYLDPSTGLPKTLSIADQFALFDQAIAEQRIPTTNPAARLDPRCLHLVVLALERRCPTQNPANGRTWRISPPASTVVRCTAAALMRTHFGLIDLSDPGAEKRARFRVLSSVENPADPGNAFPSEGIAYPKLLPRVFTVPPCPEGFKPPNAQGECEIDPL